jgi:hypothetical protein
MLWIQTFLTELHAWEWLAIFVTRLVVGLLFLLSGRGKLFVRERREQMRQTLIEAHVPFPEFNTVFVSTVEFVCGALSHPRLIDTYCLRDAWRRNDCGNCDHSDSKYQSNISARLAVRILISSRGALSRDSNLAFFLRARMAQC